MGAEPAWRLPRGPPGGILSVGPFVARAGLGLSSPPPALPPEVCPRLRSHSLGEGLSLPWSLGAWGSLTASLGLDARLEIINAINIHNEQPGEMVRAIVCSSPGLAPEGGQSGSWALTPQHRLSRRRRPPQGSQLPGSTSSAQPCWLPPGLTPACGWERWLLFPSEGPQSQRDRRSQKTLSSQEAGPGRSPMT